MDAWLNQLDKLPDFLGSHMTLTLTALSIGIAFSLPLALLVVRVRPLQAPALAVASVMQTVPSIAMLALMVPLLGTIGFLPAVIALTLYSILPVMRNTVTGIEDVDPDLVEAGQGLGMTPTGLLWRVQLPLAAPVIIAGIRTATVWVVGIATLSTPVGATSLGNYIFSGLQTRNDEAVLMGVFAAAILALILDGLIRLMELSVRKRSRRLGILACLGLATVMIVGLAPAIVSGFQSDDEDTLTIGTKTFTEQYILARVIADKLEEVGYETNVRESLGSTIAFDALANGDIDCYVDYTGTIWANYMNREDNPGSDVVLRKVTSWLKEKHNIVSLGPLGFENAYALAMRGDEARSKGIETISDLAAYSDDMTIGGDYEFFARPDWTSVRDAYNLEFEDQVSMDSALMYDAVNSGQVDVIAAFSTDGRIAAFDLAVLDDPKDTLPPYDAVLLLSAEAAEGQRLVETLRTLIDSIDDDAMREANKMVDVDSGTPSEAATFLSTQAAEGQQQE